MGNSLGKAKIKEEAAPFINLPRSLVLGFRQAVYEVAEDYGLTLEELKEVVRLCLREFLCIPETNIDEYSESLFRLFNGNSSSTESKQPLVDSFELIASLCLSSGMELDEKIHFLFDLFDFSETGDLNINETTLAFRTVTSGASKIECTPAIVDLKVIDQVATEAFESLSKGNLNLPVAVATDHGKLNRNEFFNYVFDCPESKSLLDHFDGIHDGPSSIVGVGCESSVHVMPLRFSTSTDENESKTKAISDGPWKDQIRFLKPPHHDDSISSPPTQGLSLDWIYGRNTKGPPALYGLDGSIFYPAGSMVVKLSVDRLQQTYFSHHSGHVTSIDLQCDGSFGEIVASADAGNISKICIWSAADMKLLITISRFHKDGVAKLNFSPSGHLLLTLGNNEFNTIAVYDWRKKKLVFTCGGPEASVIYDCRFLCSDNRFGVCGSEAVYFWTRFDTNQPFSQSRGVFKRLSSREEMTSLSYVGDNVITGSSSGRLWMWEGRVCLKFLAALHSPVTCLNVLQNSGAALCASTADGMVYLFDSKFEVTAKLSISSAKSSEPERFIDSLSFSSNLGKLLIGQSNSLCEASIEQQEHSRLFLGQHLAKSFTLLDNTIFSVGGAGILTTWDATTHNIKDSACFDSNLSCIAYSKALDQVAIGLASDNVSDMASKSFIILSGKDIKTIYSGCNAQNSLTTCNYSDDGRFLAFGSEDFGIYIHLPNEKNFPLIAKCRGHTGPISSIDFGFEASSTFLRSNSQAAGEAMFWRASDGKSQTPMSQRQTKWESQSCTLCWSLEGAHELLKEQNPAALISSCCLAIGSNDGHPSTVYVGESNGKLQAFHHPVNCSPLGVTYTGHSGTVTHMLCSKDSSMIYSMSNHDSCLFQWKCTELNWNIEPGLERPEQTQPTKAAAFNMDSVIQQLDELDFTKKAIPVEVHATPMNRHVPWKRSIVPPTKSPPTNNELPNDTLSLERIHGYDGKGRNNLHSLSAGNEILYSIGKILVRFNVDEDTQRFYTTDGQITCLSVHTGNFKSICAIACEGTESSTIHIIDCDTMRLLRRMPINAMCMDFDHTGRYLALRCYETICVFDWNDQALIASSKTFSSSFSVKFVGDSTLVECSPNFVRLWRVNGSIMTFEEVVCDKTENQSFSCVSVQGSIIYVGTSSGQLIVTFANCKIKAHASTITCIAPANDGIVTGSSDGYVKVWNPQMRCSLSINTHTIGVKHEISSVTRNSTTGTVFIGTTGNDIWQLKSGDGSIGSINGRQITRSHSSSFCGLSVNPTGFAFATSGDDGSLRLWNIFDHNECKVIGLEMPSSACVYSPDGRMIAIGFGKPVKENARTIDGRWVIMNIHDDSNQVIAERRDSRKHVSNIKWHSNGSRIAVGSHDKICIYEVSSKTTPAIKLELSLLSVIELKHPATHFDFSRDANYLRVNTEGKQLEFYEAGPGIHIQEASRLKDISWDSDTCTYGWDVQGIHSPYEDGTEVVSLDNSHNDSSLVCGDNIGRLRLYRHPCTSNQAHFIKYSAHLGPIGKVRWLPGGSYLISTGNYDNSIMVWKHEVIEDEHAESNAPIKNTSSTTGQDELFIPKDMLVNVEQTSHQISPQDLQFDKPAAKLVHLHGYQSMILGNSAFYDCSGGTIYPVSNLVANCHRKINRQHFFNHHEAVISALCICNAKKLVASASGNIRVWDHQTSTEIVELSVGYQGHCVSCLTFSEDGTRLASISHDDTNSSMICIFVTLSGEWNDGILQARSLAGHRNIYFGVFTAFDTHQNYLVTGGAYHINFWTEGQSSLVPSQQSVNDSHICALSADENLVTGTKSGLLVSWQDKCIRKEVKAHNGSILAISGCPEGLVSAGSDGMVIIWCKLLQKIASFEVKSSFGSMHQTALCSLDVFPSLSGDSTTRILVGTRSSELFEISLTTRAISAICSNHEFGHVEDAALNPSNQNQFATVGKDKTIRVWNLDTHQTLARTASELPLRCIDWSKDGSSLIVGCDTQSHKSPPYTFMLLNATNLSIINTAKDSDHSITAVKFSADSSMFACAAANFKIYVHENSAESNFKVLVVADKHNSIVTALDFSIDSLHFQGMSSNYEVITFSTETGQPAKADEVEWSTNSCMHKPLSDSSPKVGESTCSQLSNDHRLLVVGMTSGCVELTKFDETKATRQKCLFNAHCGSVAKSILSDDGTTLITVGKVDRTVKIWSVTI